MANANTEDNMANANTEDNMANDNTEDNMANDNTEDNMANDNTEDNMANGNTEDNMANENTTDKKELRVLMVGPTGSGKSSTGNTIMMANDDQKELLMFRVDDTSDSVTRFNEEFTRTVLGRRITIVDTPGANNIKDNPKAILEEIRSVIKKSNPPCDVILYVVSAFRTQLHLDDTTLEVFKLAESILGEEFWNYCVLVFTFKDKFLKQLKNKAQNKYEVVDFHEFIRKDKTSNNIYAIGPFVEKARDAAVSINNEVDNQSDRQDMVKELLLKIEDVKKRNDGKGFNKEKMPANPKYPGRSWQFYICLVLPVIIAVIGIIWYKYV